MRDRAHALSTPDTIRQNGRSFWLGGIAPRGRPAAMQSPSVGAASARRRNTKKKPNVGIKSRRNGRTTATIRG